VIARLWRGWTRPQDGDVYALFLRSTVFPTVAGSVPGFRGAYVLRREDGSEDEFLVLTVFESLEAVRAFAGDEYAVPVIEPEAARLITRGDDLATHYEIVGHATPPLEARD
jgi:antibiotic biosynthesis monooxygenase (ABM) superfamily enzyme